MAGGPPCPPSAPAPVQARPVPSAPHGSLGKSDKATEFGERLGAPERDPRLFSLLRQPLTVIPQLSATFLRTSNPPPGNLGRTPRRGRTKGQRTKSRGGRGGEGRGELPPFGSARGPSAPVVAAPGAALPARRGAPAGGCRSGGPPRGVPAPGVAVGPPARGLSPRPLPAARAQSGSGSCPAARRPLLPCLQEHR